MRERRADLFEATRYRVRNTTASRAALCAACAPCCSRRRGRGGLIRRRATVICTSGNIAFDRGPPDPVSNALEFDPVVASGDVLYDLAFLLMDLVERKLPQGRQPACLNVFILAATRPSHRSRCLWRRCRCSWSLPGRDPRQGPRRQRPRQQARPDRRQAIAARGPRPIFAAGMRSDRALRRLAWLAIGGLSGTGKSVTGARALAPDPRTHRRVRCCCAPTSSAKGDCSVLAENEKLPPQGYAGGYVRRKSLCHARRQGRAGLLAAGSFGDHRRRVRTRGTSAARRLPNWARTNTFDFRGLFLTADSREHAFRAA